jgi:glycosyltransferase involved in cell wall biosynthesis
VLYCGIDLEPFRQEVSREAVRQELGIPKDAPVVGHVGRFTPQKNHAFLLQIAAEVVKMRPDVRFLLVGDGPLRPQIEARARELGIAGNAIFTGVRSDVPRLMLGAMDAFIFPSLWEGLGLVVVEAQAAGLPCIVSEWVPAEATVLPEGVERVPLSGGQGQWVLALVQALEHRELDRGASTDLVAASAFSIVRSAHALEELYRNAT